MFRLNLSKVDEDVLGLFDNWLCLTQCAVRVDEFSSCHQFTASIALITLGVGTTAKRTLSSNQSISQEPVTGLTELLINNLLIGELVSMNLLEYVLSYGSLLFSSSSAKVIEVAIEPFVDLGVNLEIVVTHFLR